MNDFQSLQDLLLGPSLASVLLWTYAVAGGIFIIYAFVIFIQVYIKIKIRGTLSVFFFVLGVIFLNFTGRIITGYTHHFTIAIVSGTILLAAVGAVFVVVVYQENKVRREIYKEFMSKNL